MAVRSLLRNTDGVSATEFALIAPLLFALAIGTTQMGKLFFVHAGLRNLVSEGARLASVSPRPTDAAIKARLLAGGFGLQSSNLSQPTITYGRTLTTASSTTAPPVANTSAGAVQPEQIDWAEITMSYTVQMDYVFWRPAATVLTETRRVFIYPNP